MLVSNTCRDCPKLEVVRRLTGRQPDEALCVMLFKLTSISDEDGWETTELFSDALDGLLEEHFKDSNITLMYVSMEFLYKLS